MKPGIYEHRKHPGNYYLFIGLAADHATGHEQVVYLPLYMKPEWVGRPPMYTRTPENFEETFTWVGERLPDQSQ
jgi:hypothetical protein